MAEPAEFSGTMDPPSTEEERGSSPYMKLKAWGAKKIEKQLDNVTREINDEDNREHVEGVRGVANDLVEPETLQR
jgi:hypothetical protein